jgi:hypothetical protein
MKCHANRRNLPKFEGKFGMVSQSRDLIEKGTTANSVCYVTVCLSHTAPKTLDIKELLLQGVDFEYINTDSCAECTSMMTKAESTYVPIQRRTIPAARGS